VSKKKPSTAPTIVGLADEIQRLRDDGAVADKLISTLIKDTAAFVKATSDRLEKLEKNDKATRETIESLWELFNQKPRTWLQFFKGER